MNDTQMYVRVTHTHAHTHTHTHTRTDLLHERHASARPDRAVGGGGIDTAVPRLAHLARLKGAVGETLGRPFAILAAGKLVSCVAADRSLLAQHQHLCVCVSVSVCVSVCVRV